MASRRLDISSLLCDDSQSPSFSPLEALVQAATEERKRLAVDEPRPSSSSGRPPIDDHHIIRSPVSPHLTRHEPPQRLHLQQPQYGPRQHTHHDNLVLSEPPHLPQHHHLPHHQHHRSQEFDPRLIEADLRRRRIQEAEHQQRLQEQQRIQQLEFQRQEQERVFRAQEHERRRREEEHRLLERQREERREAERELQQREYQRQQKLLQAQREAERQRAQLELVREAELRQREGERQRELAERQQREAAERQRALERHREMERREHEQREFERIHELKRPQHALQDVCEPQYPSRYHDPRSLAPTTPHAPHPPSISHLISHPPPRKSDPPQITHSSSPIAPDPPPLTIPTSTHDDHRPIKKRRYSESPTRPMSDDKERLAREREKMVVGELGYGRVDSPVAGPSSAPRRPGSGHSQGRKVAVADLLTDKAPPSTSRPDPLHRMVSPLGRRSPPGSQIGRAKAARKSDEFLSIPTYPTRDDIHPPTESEPRKIKEEPRSKHELKPPPRSRQTSAEARIPAIEDRPKKSIKSPPLPPPPKIQQASSKTPQDDAHEWFLHQYDQEPSPTTSLRPEPPHTPSPSVSPVTSTLPAPSVKSPPAPHKSLTPITAAVALEQELEDLVSSPTVPVGPATTSTTIVKKQELDDMDLDLDLAVTELVETLENDDMKDVGMEVDVEDELLSLVDDRPPPSSSSARRASGAANASATSTLSASTSSTSTSHASATPAQSATVVNAKQNHQVAPPIRSASETSQSHPSPPTMTTPLVASTSIPSPLVGRQSSARPASERGSMPPPASTTKTNATKKVTERAGSVIPSTGSEASTSTGTKKKKETGAKAANAKSKAASSSSGAPATAAKPKAKGTAKGKKAAADALSPTTASTTAPKPAKGAANKKTAPSTSRSRSTSVMPAGSASVGPESDAVKAEKQEEEEDSDAANEDDKLYCVCKTKYDEDRFMIACDRCDDWYHTQCVNMPDLEVDLVDQFICPPCVEKNPHLNLRTTYKQRCLFGLRHPDPSSPKACHKAARGAFSKYCSDECGVKYMQTRIDTWSKKGGKTEKLWESVKNAEKREGVVVCAVDPPEPNGCVKMEVDVKDEADVKPLKPKIVPPSKTKVQRETERLNGLLDSIVSHREEIKRGMEVIVWRERLLQLASERAEQVGQCGWDQRLCFDDEEWANIGADVLESYEAEGIKKETDEGEMEVDSADEQWWCPGQKVCERHAGWQTVRYKDVCKEKEKKEEALAKLTVRERELRKRIEDMLEPQDTTTTTTSATKPKDTANHAPLKSSNAKQVNGHPKSKASTTTTEKKGKKRKAPTA